MRKKLSVVMVFALMITLFTALPASAMGEKTITVVHTNDVHGRAQGNDKELIGYARLKTFYDSLKAENPDVLLLDAGDTMHGTTFANLSDGENMMTLMNEIGYDVSIPGNHDFNYGYEQLVKLSKMAKFDYLASNVVKKDGKSDFKQNVIKEVDGIKVGIFALSTPETKYKSSPKNTVGVEFTDYIATAEKEVKELKKQGADVIIAVTHLGVDKSSKERSDILAEKVDGIDLIIDGHSHTKLDSGETVNGVLIAQTGEHLKNIGIVKLNFKDKKLVSKTAELLEFKDASKLEPDKKIMDAITEMDNKNRTLLEEKVGKTTTSLEGERENVRTKETNLGDLVADAMRKAVDADVALTNGGGIRASIQGPEVTMGDILTSFPFTNFVVKIEVKGVDIRQALEHGIDAAPEAAGKFPQISGMSFEYDSTKEKGSKITKIMIGDAPIDDNKTYTLATNDFVSIGGDDYTMLKDKKKVGEGALLSDVLVEYIKNSPDMTVNYKTENRITDKKSETKATENPVKEPAETSDKKSVSVVISKQQITLNGQKVEIPAYNIDGYNYFMLRDVAALLKDTSAKYKTDYDKDTKTVLITKGEVSEGEISVSLKAPQKISLSTQKITIDGKNADVKAYLIDNSNFFMLQDLGKALGFDVKWDENTKTVVITTSEATLEKAA